MAAAAWETRGSLRVLPHGGSVQVTLSREKGKLVPCCARAMNWEGRTLFSEGNHSDIPRFPEVYAEQYNPYELAPKICLQDNVPVQI